MKLLMIGNNNSAHNINLQDSHAAATPHNPNSLPTTSSNAKVKKFKEAIASSRRNNNLLMQRDNLKGK